ncbi:hypothetical protein XU18_2299 [Perkinsela sp. CCAP 1560/4]|nr:hypothetical protein XU18_2299 [Perkinsela sp. CCAP 1560/4]|eukprot:KNH06941.1 hypothetical protein XU18_2299 [Perkinsela sp. CCAP 1560/4]
MKRTARIHNRPPSTYGFRKPYEFAAISIRWQPTFSYIQNARNYSTNTKTITTPNFGTIPMPDVGNLDARHQDLSNVQIESVSDISVSALRGPWLMLFTESGSAAGKLLPSGELMIESNGIVYFRPGSELGHGIGRIELSTDGNFSMTLETYLYEQKAKFPPNEPDTFVFTGIVQRAVVGSHGTSIFTFNGRVVHTSDANRSFQFQAAKMDGWSEETHAATAYRPDLTLTHSLERIIPPMSSFPLRPKLDLAKYKVGDVPNIYYIPNWCSAGEEETMLKILQATPNEAKQQLDRRKVQEYGGTMCSTCNTSFVSEGNLPTWCTQVCNGLTETGVFTPATFPNNVRIHEYEMNEGIGPHVDGPIYVPVVAILSLASSCVMSFYPRREPYENPMDHYNDTFKFDGEISKQKPICSIVLEPRSLIVFSHDIYWYHPHGIRAESVDSLKEEETGPIVNSHLLEQIPASTKSLPRTYRVGVTVRHLLPRCNHQPTRAEHFMNEAYTQLHGIPKAAEQTAASKISRKPTPAESPVPIAPEPPQRKKNVLPKIRGSAGPVGLEGKRNIHQPTGSSGSSVEGFPTTPHAHDNCSNHTIPGQSPMQSPQSATSAHPAGGPQNHTMAVGNFHPHGNHPAVAPMPWQSPMPAHPYYMPCYVPMVPMCPFPVSSPFMNQFSQGPPPSPPPSYPPPTVESDRQKTEISGKLSDILNRIHSVEENISKLESTVENIKSTDSPIDANATSQILQGLMQSHMRLKEDHGEILDRVCKAVVETNHMVKNIPKRDS